MIERSWTARLPWVMLAVTTVSVAVMVPLSLGQEPIDDTISYGLIALALSGTGAFVASRQPSNPIGWIFCAQGLWNGLLEMWGEGMNYHGLATSEVGRWIINWSWIADICAYGLVFALFPTGRLLSRRWRWVVVLLALAFVTGIPGQGLTTTNPENPSPVDSPVVELLRILALVLLMLGLAGAIVSLVIRFRRSVGLERLQLKQLVLAGAIIMPIGLLAVVFWYETFLVRVLLGIALLALPVAAGLAIMRYRLYDIDVVINRTLVYGTLTASLAAVYLGSVLVLQLVLSTFTDGSGLAVAASTLAVAALFRPARGRIQATVDRRFFRSKYDAAQTLTAFGSHLRDQVDLADIGTDLLSVVGETVQPSHASLWLRGTTGGEA
jgi:hypothetical protein